MPDLGEDGIQNTTNVVVRCTIRTTRIAFGVNTEDNRVYVNYKQVTTLLWNNSSFLVPG